MDYSRSTTGSLLILVATLVIISQIGLVLFFDFPGVFDEPPARILERYHEGGVLVRASWALFAFGCLMLIPIASLLEHLLSARGSVLLRIGTVFGMVAGFSYVMGIMRWVLVTHSLAAQFVDPAVPESSKESILLIFRALDVYCGNSFGETVAPLSNAIWAFLLGCVMVRSMVFARWMGWAQIACGVLIFMRPLEYVGLEVAAEFGDLGTLSWTVLLMIMGVHLLRAPAGGPRTDGRGALVASPSNRTSPLGKDSAP